MAYFNQHQSMISKRYLTFFSKSKKKKPFSAGQLIGLILGPLLFLLTLLFFHPQDLPWKGVYVLAITLWIATWWITEAIPIAATSLLPIVLLPLGHILTPEQVSSEYGNDIIFLFLGGFILAIAMERWNLHTRVALTIINLIGLAIIKEAHDLQEANTNQTSIQKFEKSLVLAIGYAGTIGGLGTLIGTPPLIILKGQYMQHFGHEISFAKWMIVGIPTVIVLLGITWLYLRYVAFRHDLKYLPGGQTLIKQKLDELGKMKYEEKVVQTIFVLASLLWITREFLLKKWEVTSSVADGTIAIFISILLFIIPAKNTEKHRRIIDWEVAKELPWGVLILFGGGLALAKGISESGLAKWLGEQLKSLNGVSPILIVIVITIFVLFLTEVTSNTATATMILPILATLSVAVGVHPLLLMAPAAMAANCAYMLPVGTPPNAIIFGSGKISIKQMASVGFWVNLISAIIIILVVYYVMPIVLGIDINQPLPLK
ncbi:TPA: SLC13 family permease [Staphylococcus aureus]|nr:SLC13 family permease [Staphylococcus aureus]HDI7716142.1 SLC13 family permease [Staphylococcus aureus]